MSWEAPYWWASTAEARQQVAKDFDRIVGTEYGRDEIPFQRTASADGRSPWVTHPSTGERLTGAPGTSLMQHLKDAFGHPDVQSVWNQDYEVGKAPGATIAKVAADETKPVYPEATDDELRAMTHQFSFGACGGLAMALHQRTGWPLIKVTDAENVYAPDGNHMGALDYETRQNQLGTAGMGAGGLHWLVQRPDGKLVDVNGAHHPHEVVSQYEGEGDEHQPTPGAVALGKTDYDDAHDEYVDAKGEPVPLDEIRRYVPAVLRHAGQ